jgi:type I restriction enzyme, S subunit
MNRGWPEVPLGDVLTPVSRFESREDQKVYQFAGTYSYGRGIFKGGVKPGSSFNLPAIQRIEVGDFIYCKIMAWEGAFGVAGEDVHNCWMSGAFTAFRPVSGKVDARFLHYWFKAERNWRRVAASSTGTNVRRKSLHPDDFRQVRISLPLLAEQRRIVARLDAIENRLTRAQRLREEQEHELDATLRSAFHEVETYAQWKPMSELAPLVWRQIAIDPEASYTEYGVRSFYKGIFMRRQMPGSAFSWQELYRLQTGDIVFSNIMAWEKAIAVAGHEHDGWVGNHRMLVCEPRLDVILPGYLHHYFMTSDGFAKVLKASPGTAARNKTLKGEDLMAIQVPVPPLSQQQAFEALCRQVGGLRVAKASQATELAALFPSLLDRVFES